ncbi:MAG: DNA polymerase III, subunit gamma and tau [Omnitrophica bacterium GWA2_52_12]|nr:MAG: DNA polymerase III, subunit gamma and tau [Omnitrophica bacterium GWA2_52_12]
MKKEKEKTKLAAEEAPKSEYQIFARKFRPQSFTELIGQESIVRTLKNALEQGRVPQSFLFAGPRGTGKTSSARILAKALNCVNPPMEKCGGQCETCREITEGISLDVLEIDGASNRGIEEIRSLRETVKFKPSRGRYKIYIIDEVHMLTTEAFNALLKTLEEPPAHVKFIFATTEAHRVPLTILSRCQRFNFRRIPAPQIAAKLAEIAGLEKIECEQNAFFLMARASEGGLRDAESLLDQMASFCPKGIREEDVSAFLGLASETIFRDIHAALRGKDAAVLFECVRRFYDAGGDLVQFARGLFEYFRSLALCQSGAGAEVLSDLSPEQLAEIQKRKDDFSRGELLLALSLLQNLQGHIRRNIAPARLLVETALVKMLYLDSLQNVSEMLAEGPAGGQAQQPGIPSAARPPVRPAGAGWSPSSESAGPPRPSATTASLPSTSTLGLSESASAGFAVEKNQDIALTPSVPKAVVAAAEAGDIPALWPRIIDYVKSQRMSIGVFLSEAEVLEVDSQAAVLGLPAEFQFHKETLEKEANRRLVEEAFEVVAGRKLRVRIVITQVQREEKPAGKAAAAPEAVPDGRKSDILEEALNVFKGARLVRKE